MTTIERKVHFGRGKKSEKKLLDGEVPLQGRVPRISKLMALAIRFDELIRSGVVRNFAELAELGQVSRNRITQIMNLLLLAPDIQERLLFLPRVESGPDPIYLKDLQRVAKVARWEEQRKVVSHDSI
jgi:hypothetical protein